MVPMNLLRGQPAAADYVVTGSWGEKAAEEATLEGKVRIAWSGKATAYDRLPAADELAFNPDAPYVHITANETIQGVEFDAPPDTGRVPLVCDASSNFLSRPIDVRRYGLIYACAQKNAGPAGVTIVLLRADLLERIPAGLPSMLDYRQYARENSLLNTPPTFAVYVVKLVTDWLLGEVGGLEKMHEQNRRKARLLYDAIDTSGGYYRGHAQPHCRSLMNVTFRLESPETESRFLAEAARRGLCELKGHRSVGGVRASIYNAMPMEGVERLAQFMADFRRAARS
jgi:phosphoserine aminotransferase